MSLGSQIKKYRLAHKWTLEDLSERSGVDLGTISALEVRGSRRSEKGPAIAKALGLSLEQLLDEEKDWFSVAAVFVISEEVKKREIHGAAISPWPFVSISHADWMKLSEFDRGRVEGYAEGLLNQAGGTHLNRKTLRR